MQNKFGLKDFVLLVLVIIVMVLSVLAMRQDDRRWEQNETLVAKIDSVEQQLARLETKLESGVVVSGSSGTNGSATNGSRDLMWVKDPAIDVAWFDMPGFASDPRSNDDYRIGGTFIETFEAQPRKLTPILGEDVYGRRVQDQVCERLAEFDAETLELTGWLAEAWQYDPEGYWVRVKIRDVARFSDGQPVTAEDVRWTFHDYINNPELETESIRSIMSQIDRIEVVSDRVVDIFFKYPDAYNLQSALQFYILPKHFYEQFTPTQINQATALTMGSGPFKFEVMDVDNQWTPGEDAVLVRNEQYWGPKPAIAEMRFNTISEDVPRLTAFTNGETSMILPTSPQYVEKVQQPGWDDQAHSLKWVNMRSGYGFIGWELEVLKARLVAER